ncbi:MAG: hypothetical protein SV253_09055 [Halobacteria archaeon]|nr:hypothetical protein [Halobacteria archaeon]
MRVKRGDPNLKQSLIGAGLAFSTVLVSFSILKLSPGGVRDFLGLLGLLVLFLVVIATAFVSTSLVMMGDDLRGEPL